MILRALVSGLKSKFMRDTATLQLASLLNQSSQLISTVAIAYLLGAEGQGLYVSAIALQALAYFLVTVGVTQATVSQVAAAGARGNRIKTAGWIAFMAKTMLLFGLGILALGYFVLPAVGELIYDTFDTGAAGHGREIGQWAWLLCLQPLLDLPRVTAGVAFQGTRRMLALGQIENGQEVVRLFLVVLGATITGSPLGAIVGHLVACAIGSVVAIDVYRRARREDPGLLPTVGEVVRGMRDVPMMRGIRLGFRVALLKNGHVLFINVFPRLIIGGVVGLDWVAYFHIAQRFMDVFLVLALGVKRTALPALSELAGLKDVRRFQRMFWKITLITGGIHTLGLIGAMPFIRPLVAALFPDGYARPVWTFYWILSLGYIPVAFATGIESFYIATNQIKAWLWLTLIGAALTIPTNVWLIMHIPYTGTAWGLSLYQSWILVHLGYATFFFATRHGESTWQPATPEPGPKPST